MMAALIKEIKLSSSSLLNDKSETEEREAENVQKNRWQLINCNWRNIEMLWDSRASITVMY